MNYEALTRQWDCLNHSQQLAWEAMVSAVQALTPFVPTFILQPLFSLPLPLDSRRQLEAWVANGGMTIEDMDVDGSPLEVVPVPLLAVAAILLCRLEGGCVLLSEPCRQRTFVNRPA